MPLIIYMQYGGHFYQSPKGVFFFCIIISFPSFKCVPVLVHIFVLFCLDI